MDAIRSGRVPQRDGERAIALLALTGAGMPPTAWAPRTYERRRQTLRLLGFDVERHPDAW